MAFLVLDTETTGLDPDQDALVEIATAYVADGRVMATHSALIKPPIPIPPTASAVHHIVDEDVAFFLSARDAVPPMLDNEGDVVYVAHNAKFEQAFLAPYMSIDAKWICTYKCALRLWPDAPSHSNQVLRYWRKLPVDRAIADVAHRAEPDVYVTAHLLIDMLPLATLDDMLQWSIEPPLLPTCPIGKEWRGKKWSEVEYSFLSWILGNVDDQDIVWNARFELNRRAEAQVSDKKEKNVKERQIYLTICKVAIGTAQSYDDLLKWYAEEEINRRKWHIEKGDDDDDAIRGWCKERKRELERTT